LFDGTHEVVRAGCEACGGCAAVCEWDALRVLGRAVLAEDIVRQAERLRPFFAHSGGGITLTGGEVAMHTRFAAAVLTGCRALGIHTAIETSGACAWEALEPLVNESDLILYDLKLHDSEEHRRWTGLPNDDALANARLLPTERALVRIPLVPGITDTQGNLEGIFGFMADLGLCRVSVLPYNPSAPAKYEWLGRSFPLGHLEPQSPARRAEIRSLGARFGLEVEVEGAKEAYA
jgi:pyruvate formate lyase activating enzyme